VNPPWIYGPKEVGEWIGATYGYGKEKRRKEEAPKREDVRIRLFRRRERTSNRLLAILGYCEEDLEDLTRSIIEPLYRSGFKKVISAEVGGKRIDLKNPRDLERFLPKHEGIRRLRLILAKGEMERVFIKIRRFYPCRTHPAEIRIEKGSKEDISRISNLLRRKGFTLKIRRSS